MANSSEFKAIKIHEFLMECKNHYFHMFHCTFLIAGSLFYNFRNTILTQITILQNEY